MSLWIVVPLLAFAVLVQVAWIPLIPILGYKPDIPLILVVVWSLIGPIGQAAQWGFILGIFLDLTSGLPFGIHMLTLTGIGLLMGLGQTTFFRGNVITPPASMLMATFLYNVLILAILSLFNQPIAWSDYLVHISLPTAILNTLFAPIVYLPLQRLYQRVRPLTEY